VRSGSRAVHAASAPQDLRHLLRFEVGPTGTTRAKGSSYCAITLHREGLYGAVSVHSGDTWTRTLRAGAQPVARSLRRPLAPIQRPWIGRLRCRLGSSEHGACRTTFSAMGQPSLCASPC
jgi:hypothetical protein